MVSRVFKPKMHLSPVPCVSSSLLLAVSQKKKSGLILYKPYHAEFAGPGAAINSIEEQPYLGVIAVGAPDLVQVKTYQDRQNAYSRRIQWIRWLQKIAEHQDPLQRAEKLLTNFEEFFGRDIVAQLPDTILSLLIGVFPQTVSIARSQHFKSDTSDPAPDSLQKIHILHPISFQILDHQPTSSGLADVAKKTAYYQPCRVI